jgi:hypothetical protein
MGSKCSGVVDEFEPTHVVHLAARTDLRGRHVSDYTANTDRTKLLLAALTGVRFPPSIDPHPHAWSARSGISRGAKPQSALLTPTVPARRRWKSSSGRRPIREPG